MGLPAAVDSVGDGAEVRDVLGHQHLPLLLGVLEDRLIRRAPQCSAQDPASGSSGGAWAVRFGDQPSGIAFTQVRTQTTATGAGAARLRYCVTVEATCETFESSQLVASVAGMPDGIVSFGAGDRVSPGTHGIRLSFDEARAGGGRFVADAEVLFVYP